MATLDTGLGWVNGDVERVLIAYGIGVSGYSIDQMTVCCNELGEMSGSLVSVVRDLLDEYDNANEVQRDLGVEGDAGRVLVKADVLEWEVDKGGRYGAVMNEKGRISNELGKIFSFCPIMVNSGGNLGVSLIRS